MKVLDSPLTQRVCFVALLSGCSASHLSLQVEDECAFDGGGLVGTDASTSLDGEVEPPRDAEAEQDSTVDSKNDASVDKDASVDTPDAEAPDPVVIEDPDLEETSLCVDEVPSFVAMFSDGRDRGEIYGLLRPVKTIWAYGIGMAEAGAKSRRAVRWR